jgi:hypothetical protein
MAVTKVCGGGVQLVGRVLRKAAAAHGFCVALVQHTTCHSFISHNDALGADYRFIWPITKLLGSRGTNANGVHIPWAVYSLIYSLPSYLESGLRPHYIINSLSYVDDFSKYVNCTSRDNFLRNSQCYYVLRLKLYSEDAIRCSQVFLWRSSRYRRDLLREAALTSSRHPHCIILWRS